MARPPHPIGTAGKVRTYATGRDAKGRATGWRARTTYRDPDGVTREVQRTGRSEAAAKRNLAEAIRDRVYVGGGEITADSRVTRAAEAWFGELQAEGRSANTLQQYRRILDVHVLKGIGQLRIRELTIGTCDRFLRTVETKHGASTAKMARSVLSGICGWCARRDLIDRNPVRDTGSISTKPKKQPRALTIAEAIGLRTWLRYSDLAIRRDIPELVDFCLSTGLRVGEACAVHWWHLDLDEGTVELAGNVVRIKGVGLVVQQDESSKLHPRTLELPGWEIASLKARKERRSPKDDDPVFPAPKGGLRDPSNTNADLRDAVRWCGYPWVTSHTFRRTVATWIDEAGHSARAAADQLGHAHPSMTQDRYFGRRRVSSVAAAVLSVLDDPEF